MVQVLFYLPMRFIANVQSFLEHWYARSFLHVSHFTVNLFENLDRALAIRINLRNLFKPLYQDRSPISYIIGFFFRGFKIILALLIYSLSFLIIGICYLAWALLPIFLVYKILISVNE